MCAGVLSKSRKTRPIYMYMTVTTETLNLSDLLREKGRLRGQFSNRDLKVVSIGICPIGAKRALGVQIKSMC